MYFPVCLLLLVVSRVNGETPSEEWKAIMEEKMAEMSKSLKMILTKMAKETSENDISSPKLGKLLNDTDLDERVLALEFQMTNVQEEITNINNDVDVLTSEVTIIHADQVVQDERLLDVEDEVELVGRGVVTLEENVNTPDASNAQLNVSVSQLDVRVTTLESQNGTNDNVTDELNELNERVDTLDEDVTDLQITVSNLDETVTGLEETIEGLSVTVDDLDSRVSDLEASGGNGTSEPVIAFGAHSVITPIAVDSIIIFPEVDVNIGESYSSETGEFTVPPGGAGVYFLFFYTLVDQYFLLK